MNSDALFLSRLPLFAEGSSDTVTRLAHRRRWRELAPRAVVVREGSSDDSAFLILAGGVAVRRDDPESGIEFKGVLIEPPVVTEDDFKANPAVPASVASVDI